ncbi:MULTISPECIES: NUDIX hydrolase [unclassified Xanthobacter]|uniref:NUDIX hydrolase n=1 Tax=unclassified Xanthobacter TaxID=2623496 RepID=UPI001F38C7DC|nr:MULTISPECIES: NUDIX hydrolase [unclassified Xanthobacter]
MSADAVWGTITHEDRRIAPVLSLSLTLEAGGWPEADARRDEIAAHFAARQAANPHLWNGDILLLRSHRFGQGHLEGRVRQTDFASFLWWRDQGWPDLGMVNIFALAALEGADGGFLMGVMGAQTSSAGRIYFPGGTPDLSDLTADGHLDLEASLWRELQEETGLCRADMGHDGGFIAVFDGPRLALLRRLVLPQGAQDAAGRIRAFLADDPMPELSDMAIVRNVKDISPQMAPFAVAYMRHRWDIASPAS